MGSRVKVVPDFITYPDYNENQPAANNPCRKCVALEFQFGKNSRTTDFLLGLLVLILIRTLVDLDPVQDNSSTMRVIIQQGHLEII